MSDKPDFGLIISEAFDIFKTDHASLSQISLQDTRNLELAQRLARLALENLYGQNLIHIDIENYRKRRAGQVDHLADIATQTLPANRAELLATIFKDCIHDHDLLSRAVDYLSTEERLTLWELLNKQLA